MIGNGGKGVIQLLDLIFIRVFIASASNVAVDTRYRWIEEMDALQYNVANDIQRFMCRGGTFDHSMCSESDADRAKLKSLQDHVNTLNAQLERLTPASSANNACNWYKAAPGVGEVYLYDHGTEGKSIGAVGGVAGGKTTYFANSGRYPSTASRTHVRVMNSASSMHEKLGYINKNQFVVAPEKCN